MRKVDQDIINEILRAVQSDKRKRSWPNHIVAQAARVSEQAGYLLNTSLVLKYDELPDFFQNDFIKKILRSQAIETAAAAIRLIENFDRENQKPELGSQLSTENLLEESHETTELYSA